ncbi:MAG: SDR family oxidoreductase [Candidatus Rokubacteria bacterium]|nr:SDR family oxidoreductase [Candidatus Rokubacteria bacterium]
MLALAQPVDLLRRVAVGSVLHADQVAVGGEAQVEGVADAVGEQVACRAQGRLIVGQDEALAAGGQALVVKADVSQIAGVDGLVSATVEQYGRLDVLVNSAGVYLTSPVVEMSEAEWDQTMDVDLKGVFLCSQAAARQMVKQRSGRIVNITSIAQVRGGTPGHAHYGAAKAGVGAFTKTLAKELGPFGITVNCVAPGLIADTEMGQVSRTLMGDAYLATIPLGRLGAVQEVVEAVLFLASPRAGYITGETLNVNGGSHMA